MTKDAGLVLGVVNQNLRELNPKIEEEIRRQFPEYARGAHDEEQEIPGHPKRRFLYSTHFDFRFNVNASQSIM
jgi:hypothetical protein